MYYEEKIIDGKLYFRCSKEGEWILLSNERLTKIITNLQEKMKALEDENKAIREALEASKEELMYHILSIKNNSIFMHINNALDMGE